MWIWLWFWLLWWRKAGIAGREGAFLGSLGCGGFCGVSGLGFGGALGPVSGGGLGQSFPGRGCALALVVLHFQVLRVVAICIRLPVASPDIHYLNKSDKIRSTYSP